MTLFPGARLGPYEIQSLVGAGGMGEVYRGLDTRLGRAVAIKVRSVERDASQDARERFSREARAIAALNHPHICALYDVGSNGDIDYLVMELLDGETLTARLARGPLPLDEALDCAVQMSDGLNKAHEAGFVHRDLKPGNVMLTGTGVKLLDFGLAKAVPREAASHASTVLRLTAPGAITGTPAYMAPEQWEGRPAGPQTDIWALGLVILEMLTAVRPSSAAGAPGLATAPQDLVAGRTDLPPRLRRVIERALQKDPAARYPAVSGMLADLRSIHADLVASRTSPALSLQLARRLRRPAYAVPAALLLAAATLAGGWLIKRDRNIRWARNETLPRISRLADDERFVEAFGLARQAEEYIAGDSSLAAAYARISDIGPIASQPPGAQVSWKDYRDPSAPWTVIGRTPLTEVRLPKGMLRWHVEMDGYVPLTVARPAHRVFGIRRSGSRQTALVFVLDVARDAPAGMIRVQGERQYTPLIFHGLPTIPPVSLPDYWLDEYEVTNHAYKAFVEAAGYTTRKYWRERFVSNGHILSWDEAMARFVDRTGRPGPATWEMGDYRPGEDDLPVGGVSWYEASAYAAFAGKELPSLYHWVRAATTVEAQYILPLSNVPRGNFRPAGPAPVGTFAGISLFGAVDTAGNVKEWCINAAENGRRIILGGAWDEPDYMFHTRDARDPFERAPDMGFRCAKYPSREQISPQVFSWTPVAPRSYADLKPVSDGVFETYRTLYAYDQAPVEGTVEAVDENRREGWRREKVSYASAWSDERLPAYVFIPLRGTPPYQSVVVFPGSGAAIQRSSRDSLPGPAVSFLVKTGRLVIFPIYKGTFERGTEASVFDQMPSTGGAWRDLQITLAREVRRALDYLVTRPDVDSTMIGYRGLSWGANIAPLPLALDPRIRVAVLESGGLFWEDYPPEVDPVNFLPRVRIPVLMLNGGYDSFYPVHSQIAMFNLLGTPPDLKRRILYPESGHVPPQNEAMKETLAWYERYLGVPR